jgi:plasmid stability protein
LWTAGKVNLPDQCQGVRYDHKKSFTMKSKFQIDSNAFNASNLAMSTTLTIRNLDEEVKRKLRIRAASHQTSMEAEARSILAAAVNQGEAITAPRTPEEMRARLEAVRGIWKGRGTTDELMRQTRGED